MIDNEKLNIVIVDSGIDDTYYKNYNCNNIISKISINKNDSQYKISNEIEDKIGHGTAVYHIVNSHIKHINNGSA